MRPAILLKITELAVQYPIRAPAKYKIFLTWTNRSNSRSKIRIFKENTNFLISSTIHSGNTILSDRRIQNTTVLRDVDFDLDKILHAPLSRSEPTPHKILEKVDETFSRIRRSKIRTFEKNGNFLRSSIIHSNIVRPPFLNRIVLENATCDSSQNHRACSLVSDPCACKI